MRFKQAPEGHWMPVDGNPVQPYTKPQTEPIKPYSEMTDEELAAIAAEREIDMEAVKTREKLVKLLEKMEQAAQ